MAQTAAVAGLCHYALPSRFHTAAMLCLATHWFGFMLSVLISSDKWFDVTEDIAYMTIFIWAYRSINLEEGETGAAATGPSPRQQLVFSLVGLWIVRLLVPSPSLVLTN